MGDIIQFQTHRSYSNIFYKLPGTALVFYIKAEDDAVIALATQPENRINYRVFIDFDSVTYIKDCESSAVSRPKYRQRLLSDDEYTKFWMSWYNNILRLGVNDNPLPLVSKVNVDTDSIKYATFGNKNGTAYWKLLLRPTIEKPLKVKLNKGNLAWVPADNQLPDGSLIGGFENELLYIIRAKHRGSLTPGKFVPSLGLGFIPWGGASNDKSEFEVLCGYNCVWTLTECDRVPVTAVVAGYSEDQHELLYVGRAEHDGHVIPGKVQLSHKVCYIPYKGREIVKKKYEVLDQPDMTRNAANDYFENYDVVGSDGSDDDDDDDGGLMFEDI